MKKALIPASFLSNALGGDITVIQNENQMYLIRETGKQETVSRLYQLFFAGGKTKKTEVVTIAQQPVSDPDYYTSYE